MSHQDELADELEQKRNQEKHERQQAAQEVAQALSTLMLGETIAIGIEDSVMSVPGGWLFTQKHKAGISTTFVPQPPARPTNIKQQPSIVMPD
jgi:hypothetical protein